MHTDYTVIQEHPEVVCIKKKHSFHDIINVRQQDAVFVLVEALYRTKI